MTKAKRVSIPEIEQFFFKNTNILTIIGQDYKGEDEERNGLIYKLSQNNKNLNLVTIHENKDSTYSMVTTLSKRENTNNIPWYSIKEVLSEVLSEVKMKTILIDITDLDLEILIYIIPLVLDYKIFVTYILPENYSSENFTITPKGIHQPRGYTLIPTKQLIASSHIIILGFDELRAHKFIKQYDWSIDKLKLISIKDKVENCEFRINRANYFLDEKVSNCQLKEINLLNYNEIIEIIEKELKENDYVDIIPLGPKPILFHILLYYFLNYETLKDRIKFLYDFPNKSKNRTHGIKEICFLETTF
ncbi:hypothetical protein [Aliarcobacter butzleri]|uniref:Uncharacterized protein n=1 Tax=Aliarcobacter butzleri L351 TaxID=1447259 RepID=A0A837J2A2_9BACT|nr:hypothetical protein [Aliarcobacter butzleri]KLD99512.1 hypothetical protein AF76_10610 [Aliarcobacter butzleri L351]KLE12433.1 hypothetical protein AF75_07945 [Aliarcobacter butzleri L350]